MLYKNNFQGIKYFQLIWCHVCCYDNSNIKMAEIYI